jgi:NADH-quinone oxidoreductase subunit M
LFIIVGMIQERLHTRDIGQMGGLWSVMPRLGGMALVFALASLGLPGLGNFVGELLTLVGIFRVNPLMAAPAAVGLVLAAVYALWTIRRAFFGPAFRSGPVRDLSAREMALMVGLTAGIVWLGVHPQPVLNAAAPSVRQVIQIDRNFTGAQQAPADNATRR